MSTGPSKATKAGEVIGKFKSIWPTNKALYYYGIVVIPGDAKCLAAQIDSGGVSSFATRVADLAQKTGGFLGAFVKVITANP